MALKIYNTLTRKKENFRPIKPGVVLMYHCGPTVYWTQHIGNMRAIIMADLITRSLKYLDYDVRIVRNYTDVGHLTSDADEGEDKMEKAAKREKLDPEEIAKKYINIFEKDLKDLNALETDEKPRATEVISEAIEMIQTLIDKKSAYSTDLAIYFDTAKAKNYNQLSGQKTEKQKKDAGKAEISDPDKKHPADFALWFFKTGVHKNALQTWKSPFGEGFPGWHIECSVMAKKFLGNTIDIHMGGVEHIPIHHTNEIAQSEAANNVKFVNYWIHNEHLTVNGKKMAKSEGTGYSLSEIKENNFNPLALRFFFLQAHYRSKQNFTWEAMEAAQNGLNHFYAQIKELGNKKEKTNKKFKSEFMEKLKDDFNIPQALAITQKLIKSNLTKEDKLATVLDFDKVLGLKLDELKKERLEIPKKVQKLTDEREQAREEKNWPRADALRGQIETLGWIVEDKPKGSVLKKS